MHSTVQSRRSRTISPLRNSAAFQSVASDSKVFDSLYSTWQSVGSYSQDTVDTYDRSPLYSGYCCTLCVFIMMFVTYMCAKSSSVSYGFQKLEKSDEFYKNVKSNKSILLIIIIIRMNVIATLQSINFKVAATAKSCGKVKVSHAAVKSFGAVSVVRTLEQFSFQAASKDVQ